MLILEKDTRECEAEETGKKIIPKPRMLKLRRLHFNLSVL